MNIRASITTTDIRNRLNRIDDKNIKDALSAIISRFELALQDLVTQLKKEPTVFTVDPATNTADVEGAKKGDVAIYMDIDGAVEVKVFNE